MYEGWFGGSDCTLKNMRVAKGLCLGASCRLGYYEEECVWVLVVLVVEDTCFMKVG